MMCCTNVLYVCSLFVKVIAVFIIAVFVSV